MKTMTAEGEMALARLIIAVERLSFMIAHWPDISDNEYVQEMEAIKALIASAEIMLSSTPTTKGAANEV